MCANTSGVSTGVEDTARHTAECWRVLPSERTNARGSQTLARACVVAAP
jgi:hypothetical protein